MDPTVILTNDPKYVTMREEIFGPVCPFKSFDDDEEVLEYANETSYGLASYVFTCHEKYYTGFLMILRSD